MKKRNILLLDGYARQTLPMVRGFKKLGCSVSVTCFSKLDVGYASRFPDKKILLPCGKSEYDKQYLLVKEIIQSGEYDMVVPLTDYSATYLADHKEELSPYSYIAVNDKAVFDLAINKRNTMRVCKEHNIPAPKTILMENVVDNIKQTTINYPLVVKPVTACGSIGFNIATNEEHLNKIVEAYDHNNGPFLVQEYIPRNGTQYAAEAFRNKNGEYAFLLIYEMPRVYPLDGGSSTIGRTYHDEQMAAATRQLLDTINYHGYANIDFIVDKRDGIAKIIDLNARISASVMVDYIVGINVAEIILDDAFGDASYRAADYPDGHQAACCLTEFLWFLKSDAGWKERLAALSVWNKKDVVFSWSDPLPFFTYCIQSAMAYKEAMNKRKRC